MFLLDTLARHLHFDSCFPWSHFLYNTLEATKNTVGHIVFIACSSVARMTWMGKVSKASKVLAIPAHHNVDSYIASSG